MTNLLGHTEVDFVDQVVFEDFHRLNVRAEEEKSLLGIRMITVIDHWRRGGKNSFSVLRIF